MNLSNFCYIMSFMLCYCIFIINAYRMSNKYLKSVNKLNNISCYPNQSLLWGRKIDDEASSLNNSAKSKKKKKSNSNSESSSIAKSKSNDINQTNISIEQNQPRGNTNIDNVTEPAIVQQPTITFSGSNDIFPSKSTFSESKASSTFVVSSSSLTTPRNLLEDIPPPVRVLDNSTTDDSKNTSEAAVGIVGEQANFNIDPVPKGNPLKQGDVPPEIVFFGEPRNPPPGELGRDSKYHGSLLYWARHATVSPRTSEERLTTVFPRGRLHPQALKYRLTKDKLSFDQIFNEFIAVQEDLEASKSFLDVNIDLVSSKLFLRLLTAEKLTAQSKNDLERMDFLKDVRRKYMLAHDQLFFPLNLEIQKAETRVMTYLARPEIQTFAKDWDSVELSLHFTTLLAARLTWDSKVRVILDDIKSRVDASVGYMAEGLRKDLMSREFRAPGITSELYLNASNAIERNMPELYVKLKPEVQLIHETYFMPIEEVPSYTREFCSRTTLSIDQIKEKLRIYEATLAAIQGADYIGLRMHVQQIHRQLCTEQELEDTDKWYFDYLKSDYQFDTYEPDEIPIFIQYEQRLRDTVDVLKAPTQYTEAFSSNRPKGITVGNWLEYDPDWFAPQPKSYEERVEKFREAYIVQTELRKAAESRLTKMVRQRMDSQDKFIYDDRFAQTTRQLTEEMELDENIEESKNIIEFEGEDENTLQL